jgi:hypothetical protein
MLGDADQAGDHHMSEAKGHPARRLRGPDVGTIIRAAANAGRQLVSVLAQPNGDIRLEFSEAGSGEQSGREVIEA